MSMSLFLSTAMPLSPCLTLKMKIMNYDYETREIRMEILKIIRSIHYLLVSFLYLAKSTKTKGKLFMETLKHKIS